MSEHFVTFDQVVKKTVRKTVRLELLHCPFCGGEAEFRQANQHWGNGGGYGVRCKDCKVVSAIRMGAEGQLRAAELWNRRVKE
jgi:Lar family restriction alleviation protein